MAVNIRVTNQYIPFYGPCCHRGVPPLRIGVYPPIFGFGVPMFGYPMWNSRLFADMYLVRSIGNAFGEIAGTLMNVLSNRKG